MAATAILLMVAATDFQFMQAETARNGDLTDCMARLQWKQFWIVDQKKLATSGQNEDSDP